MKLPLALLALALAGCASSTVIRSYPAGAEVLVDGRPVGYTPVVYTDPSVWNTSRHLVTIYREGYVPVTAEIAASRPDDARFVLDSLFCWPCLFATAIYPEAYDFPLTPQGYRSAYRLPSSAAK